MTTKLAQILAVSKTVRASSQQAWDEAYHQLQKPAPLLGLSRRYRPRDAEGEQLPDESTKVQTTAQEQIGIVRDALTRLFDITAAIEWTNCVARADVVVDKKVLASKVPVPYLLFLEKKLIDLRTFVKKLPTLDASEVWTPDPAIDAYRSEVVTTVRTKKVPRNHVKAEATDKHPAQVETYFEDVPVGTWDKVQFSGMLPVADVKDMLIRVETLLAAVKMAREEANGTEVVSIQVGGAFLGYLFGQPTQSPQ